MKRSALAILTTATVAALSLLPPVAQAAPPSSAPQSVTGRVTAPVPANVPGAPRRVFLASRATNGVIGWAFDVDAGTELGTFALEPKTDPTGVGDLNIIFYSDPGDAANTAPTATGAFINEGVGGEKGFVPAGSKVAMVFLTGGGGVEFEYIATPAPVVRLSAESLDITVPTGASVRFYNDTADETAVRHTTDADPAFDSGPLPADATYTATLGEPGAYPFTAGTRTGTVTVTE